MSRIHANNFSTTINGSISDSDTSVDLTDVTGFPAIGGGVTCNLTLQSGSTIEIITATAISTNTLTITRGSEGTVAANWSDGASISIRPTADSMDRKEDLIDGRSFSDVGTPASGDKILLQDASDSSKLKVAQFSTFGGGGGGLSDGDYGDVTVSSSGAVITIDTPSSATVATNDKVLIKDTSASDATKYVTTQDIADLATDAGTNFTDITTNNSSTSKHGYLKKLSNNAAEYMDGTGNWSTPSGGGGSGALTLLSVATASSSADLHFDNSLITSTYVSYLLVFKNLMTASSTSLNIQLSADNGSTDVGGSDWYNMVTIDAPTQNGTGGSVTLNGWSGARCGSFVINPNANTHTSGGLGTSGHVWIHGPADTLCTVVWDLNVSKTGGYNQRCMGSGNNISGYTPPVNYVKIYGGSGNLASGTISLYGLQKV